MHLELAVNELARRQSLHESLGLPYPAAKQPVASQRLLRRLFLTNRQLEGAILEVDGFQVYG